MPTISANVSDEEVDLLKKAAAAVGERPSPYIASAVRERMRREGHIPGTPAFDLRMEAQAAAEVAGPERVLAALRELRGEHQAA